MHDYFFFVSGFSVIDLSSKCVRYKLRRVLIDARTIDTVRVWSGCRYLAD